MSELMDHFRDAVVDAMQSLSLKPMKTGTARVFYLFETTLFLTDEKDSTTTLVLVASRRVLKRKPLANALAAEIRKHGKYKAMKAKGVEKCLLTFLRPADFVYGTVQRDGDVHNFSVVEIKGSMKSRVKRDPLKVELVKLPKFKSAFGRKQNIAFVIGDVNAADEEAEELLEDDIDKEVELTDEQRRVEAELFALGLLLDDDLEQMAFIDEIVSDLKEALAEDPVNPLVVQLCRNDLAYAAYAGGDPFPKKGQKCDDLVLECLNTANDALLVQIAVDIGDVRDRLALVGEQADELNLEAKTDDTVDLEAGRAKLNERVQDLWQAYQKLTGRAAVLDIET